MNASYRLAVVGFLVVAGILGYFIWQKVSQNEIPDGFAVGNGRLEAEETDISTKYAGRIRDVLVREGDGVSKDQVLALMDTRELDAELNKAEALLHQAEQSRLHAQAVIKQRASETNLAHQELTRALFLLEKGHTSQETVDRRISSKDSAEAALNAAQAELGNAEALIHAAQAEIRRIQAQVDESVLRAPVAGRVLYRLAEPGEVLAAGGKVLTVIDLNEVYMTLFLSETVAGKVPIGAPAKIVLDALPDKPIDARVSFVSDKAQFTPKEVETRTEREKLVFRIKARVSEPSGRLLKPGMPGVAYIRIDDAAEWPDRLK
jgi:HlyD family secretion protein